MTTRVFLACLVAVAMAFVVAGCGRGGSGGGGAASVTEFDPNNRNQAALWWAGLVKEIAEAKSSQNQVRVDEVMQKVEAARAPLAGQRIRFLFRVWPANPDLPETVWNYEPISSEGVWVGLLHRADPGRIRVGMAVHNRPGPRAFLLKAGEHIDPSILSSLDTNSTVEISATIVRTELDRLDTWHQGFNRFTDAPILGLYIADIKVEKVNP